MDKNSGMQRAKHWSFLVTPPWGCGTIILTGIGALASVGKICHDLQSGSRQSAYKATETSQSLEIHNVGNIYKRKSGKSGC